MLWNTKERSVLYSNVSELKVNPVRQKANVNPRKSKVSVESCESSGGQGPGRPGRAQLTPPQHNTATSITDAQRAAWTWPAAAQHQSSRTHTSLTLHYHSTLLGNNNESIVVIVAARSRRIHLAWAGGEISSDTRGVEPREEN